MSKGRNLRGTKMEVIDVEPGQDGSLLDISTGEAPEGSTTDQQRQLGYLNNVQELIVRQQRDIRETLRGTEEPNVYFIHDKVTGEKLYHMQEKEACCQQQCCGGNRGFRVTIFDKFNRAVIEVSRPSACCYGGCFPFLGCFSCLDKVAVSVKNYKSLKFEWVPVGQVRQNWNPICPSFDVCDSDGDVKYRLSGPICTSGCGTNVVFSINDTSGRSVGSITKEWSGICTEMTSDSDLFSIKFPPGDIDEKLKATLLGGMIFIDFKYFETNCPVCCCALISLS